MNGYRHVLFDFDGVLCDSAQVAIAEFNRLRELKFSSLPELQSKDDLSAVYTGPLRTCLKRWVSDEEARSFFDLHSSAMAGRAGELAAFSGIGSLLSELPRRGASIVTSAYSDAARLILSRDKNFDARSLFRIAGRELRRSKTEKIRDILTDLGTVAKDALYVGDLESDILYCRDVPLDVVAVTYGYQTRAHLEGCKANYLVHSVAELRSLLQNRMRTAA
jgi:phosphoglycolate phosphatase